jgi:hypothetical protein
VGATIVNRTEDLRESDVGTNCGLFHIEKLGDEYVRYGLQKLMTDSLREDTSRSLPNARRRKRVRSCSEALLKM